MKRRSYSVPFGQISRLILVGRISEGWHAFRTEGSVLGYRYATRVPNAEHSQPRADVALTFMTGKWSSDPTLVACLSLAVWYII